MTLTGVGVTPVVASSPFLTAASLIGGLRNNYDGPVGMKITVGASPITVTSLGRMFFTGNSASHTVRLTDNAQTDLATASIPITGGVNNAWTYVAITPQTLSASTSYYIMSQEVNAGDQFADTAGVTPGSSDATIAGSVYADNFNVFQVAVTGNNCYVPVNFKYHL
jgi:hypothetical protein